MDLLGPHSLGRNSLATGGQFNAPFSQAAQAVSVSIFQCLSGKMANAARRIPKAEAEAKAKGCRNRVNNCQPVFPNAFTCQQPEVKFPQLHLHLLHLESSDRGGLLCDFRAAFATTAKTKTSTSTWTWTSTLAEK